MKEKKYQVDSITLQYAVPSHSASEVWQKKQGELSQKLVEKIAEGYEIYSAIPVSTDNFCAIEYILRREV